MGNYTRRGYHSSVPEWRDTSSLKGQYIGIELEVYNRRGYEHTLAALPNVRKNQRRPITEEDGSLGDDTGVEIIFPPYKYSQLRNHRSFFHTALAEMHKAGTRGINGYGMHMNVNVGGWPADKVGVFNVVINSLPESMIRNIGGRTRSREGATKWYGCGSYSTDNFYTCRVESKIGRIECRFPQSCLDSDAVIALVDFIALVEKCASSKKMQAKMRKIVEDTVIENASSYMPGFRATERYTSVTNAFIDWLDEQSKKNPTAKKVLEVLERGRETLTKESSGADQAASPAKPWCANNPDNVGKAVTLLVDEDDYYDEDDDYY